jgi:hypothetical protein
MGLLDDWARWLSELVKAIFKKKTYQVTVAVDAAGGGTTNPVPGAYTVNVGDSFTVTAVPDATHTFDHWLLDDGTTSTTNPIVLTKTN